MSYGDPATAPVIIAPSTTLGSGGLGSGTSSHVVNSGVTTLFNTTTATFATSALSAGAHAITASYAGDANCTSSLYSISPVMVDQILVTLTPLTPGAAVTFTAAITPPLSASGPPTGDVTFVLEESPTTSITISAALAFGRATFNAGVLTPGDHTITASYNGSTDAVYTACSVSEDPSATTFSSSANPSVYGQRVTFTATVGGISGSGPLPTGTIDFQDGSTDLTPGGVTMSGGMATFTTSSLSAGTHSITAIYSGDNHYLNSTGDDSNSPQTVNQATTTVTVRSSQQSVLAMPSTTFVVTFTATVKDSTHGSSGTPTGSVSFKDGTSTLATVTMSTGSSIVKFSTASLAVGNHAITATYNGDTNFISDTSPGFRETIETDTSTTLSLPVSSSLFGQIMTFTAIVTPLAGMSNPVGTVTFQDTAKGKTSTLGVRDLVPDHGDKNSTARFSTSPPPSTYQLSVGSNTITATLNANAVFLASPPSSETLTVKQGSTTTSIRSSSYPSVLGKTVTFTATVVTPLPAMGAPTGSVVFEDNGTPKVTVSLGAPTGFRYSTATFSTSSLSVGSHAIAATYSSDANFTGSTGGFGEIVKASASAIVAPSGSDELTYTATVSGDAAYGTPTGTVNFMDGATELASSVTLDNSGEATFAISALAVGSDVITATYSGDGTFAGTVPATLANASTTLDASSNPSVYGQAVTFTATVSAGAAGLPAPSGLVTFNDGGNPVDVEWLAPVSGGTESVNYSQATWSTYSLAGGNHSITAAYEGDGTFAANTSDSLTETISTAASTTSVSSSAYVAPVGGAVTFTALVNATSDTDANPTGTVTFMQGSTVLANGVHLDDWGQATFSTSSLAAGENTITAFYSGDSNFQASSGDNSDLPLDVDPDFRTVSVGSSLSPSVFGQAVTLTATVAAIASDSGPPTGTVTFLEGDTVLASDVALVSGQATFSTTALSTGSDIITAFYDSGDDSGLYGFGDDSAAPQVVNADTSVVAVSSSPNASNLSQGVTVTATVSAAAPGSGTPTGTVLFFVDGSTLLAGADLSAGQATFSTSGLTGGSQTITAFYTGDGNFWFANGDDSAAPQVVNQGDTTTALTASQASAVYGQAVTFTAAVSAIGPATEVATGTVTFVDWGPSPPPLSPSGAIVFGTDRASGGSD